METKKKEEENKLRNAMKDRKDRGGKRKKDERKRNRREK